MGGKSRLLMKNVCAKSVRLVDASDPMKYIPEINSDAKSSFRQVFSRTMVLLFLCVGMAACNNSDDDIKAIWSYEQSQSADPDFRFYPMETRQVGQLTVADSTRMITNAFNRPLDTLLLQNHRALESLLQMQSLYVKYDMEALRETVSIEINQLKAARKWLNGMKNRLEDYQRMNPAKVLIKKVECRFQYDISGLRQKGSKDKIYYICTSTNKVTTADDAHPSTNR